MIQTSIRDLAASGDLGSRCHDLSHDELRTLLGAPGGWGPQATQEQAEIWRYGDMTLANGSLQIDPWILRRGLTVEDFESALAGASIPYETIAPDLVPAQRIVTTVSGARFTFSDDPDGGLPGLIAWSIQTRVET